MSVFDPYKLYYHQTRNTRKGQVLQKKPQPPITATTSDQIPQAISVLDNFGYTVFAPGWTQPYFFSGTFAFKAAGTAGPITFSPTSLWSVLKTIVPGFSQFISDHPYAESSRISISLSSVFYTFTEGKMTFNFYDNTVKTIGETRDWQILSSAGSMIILPDEMNTFFISYDAEFGQGGYPGDTEQLNRLTPTDSAGTIAYVTLRNAWQQINSGSGIIDDLKLAELIPNSPNTVITSFSICGFLSILLNDE